MAKTRFLQIGRNRWAVGFEWHYFEGRYRQALKAARSLTAKEEAAPASSGEAEADAGTSNVDAGSDDGLGDDADAGVEQASASSVDTAVADPDCYASMGFASGFQIGLGCADGGKVGNAFSLAATLASHPEGGRWAARIPLETGDICVLAIRNGEILPEGGDFVGSPDQADAVFDEIVSESGDDEWDSIQSFETAEEASEQIEEWLDDLKATGRVRPLSAGFPTTKVIVSILAVAVLLGGGYGYSEYQAYKAEQARQERLERMQEKMQDQGPRPLPFKDAAAPVTMMKMCLERISNQQMSVLGWELDSWHCTTGEIRAEWERQSGQFTRRPPGADFDPTEPNKATQAAPTPEMESRESPGYMGPHLGFSYLLDVARTLRLQPSIQAPTPNQTPPGDQRPPVVDELTYEFTSEVRPTERMGQALSAVPGLVIEGIHWNVDGNKWRIEGSFYVDY